MSNIGVVIVTWNSVETIERCLASCGGLPVIVVDNASQDGTAQRVRRHPNVYLIANTENRGFAAAANQGIAASAADYILLLNPDVELCGPVQALVAACDEPGVAIAAGQLAGRNGVAQLGFSVRRLPTPAALALEVLALNRLFPQNRVNRRYRCLDLDLTQPQDVEQPAGAFLMFRRELWRKIGGFDEQFHPIWFEDVDFCKRALESANAAAPTRIRYIPAVRALHDGAASVDRLDWASRERCWYASLLKYASKHFCMREFRGVCAAVVLGSALRALPCVVQKRSLKPLLVHAGVSRLALRCLVAGRIQGLAREQALEQGSRVRTITSGTE